MPKDTITAGKPNRLAPSFLYGEGAWRHYLRRVYFIAYAVGRDIVQGLLPLHASSLVYTTLLSVVPLFALAFSVLKGLGGHNQLAPLLKQALAPIGPMAGEITGRIVSFVDNVNVGVLGAIGVVFLLYTSISVGRKLEDAANAIWHVSEGRSIGQSLTSYLTIIVVGPILLFSAFALTGTIMSSAVVAQMTTIGPVGELIKQISELLPIAVFMIGSILLYWFLPNTRVRFTAALAGGIVAGLSWGLAAWFFSRFVAGTASYTAIYSAFAALILLLIWVNVNWLILLAGCAVAFYVQYPQATLVSRARHVSGRVQERIALSMMQVIGAGQYKGEPPLTVEQVAHRTGFTHDAVCRTLQRLESSGLLARTADHPPRLVAAKPLDQTPVTAVWDAVRSGTFGSEHAEREVPLVDMCEQRIENAVASALGPMTLKDLALSMPPAADADNDGDGEREEKR
jgi:membrane protein